MVVTATFGGVVKFSLRTNDRLLAANRNSAAVQQLGTYYQGLRNGPRSLTHKETIAYAGEVYRHLVERFEDNPGSPQVWEAVKAFNRAVQERRLITSLPLTPGTVEKHLEAAQEAFGTVLTDGVNARPQGAVEAAESLETRFGWLVDWTLAKHALIIDDESRLRLLVASSQASTHAAWALKRNAQGDYSPDPAAQRFPAIESTKKAPAPKASSTEPVSMKGLFSGWWNEAKATGRKASTHKGYSKSVNYFVDHLGHDDASQVTPEHIIDFKNARLATINTRTNQPINPKTVKDNDLAALRSVFDWAVTNKKLPSNPVDNITIRLGRRQVLRTKGFTDEEAQALLEAAENLKPGDERPKTFAAKRWAPWLCAYTGARIGEMMQLRKEDVRKVGKHWTIHITPEAGTVKSDQVRDVVLHEHLLAKGFPEFVQGCADGHLFVTPAENGDVLGPLQGVKNRVSETARETVKDTKVQPNHGWRHRFKTIARSVGMDGRVTDAIQGHAPRTAGDDYGDITVEAIARAMAIFPRQHKG